MTESHSAPQKDIHHVWYFPTAYICFPVYQGQHWKRRSNHTITSSQGCSSLTIEVDFLLIIFSLRAHKFFIPPYIVQQWWTEGLLYNPVVMVLGSSIRVLHSVNQNWATCMDATSHYILAISRPETDLLFDVWKNWITRAFYAVNSKFNEIFL